MSDLSAPGRSRVTPPEPAPETAGPVAGRGRWAQVGTAALIAAPDRIVTVFLVAAIPVGLAVIFHAFVPAVVLPASLVLVAALWRWTPSRYLELRDRRPWWYPRPESRGADGVSAGRTQSSSAHLSGPARQAALGSAGALLVMLVWLWLNRHHLSAYLVLQRDPGIYTLRALWLVHHSTPLMDSSQEAADVAGVPGATFSSLAFPSVGTTLYPQSSALLPGLLAGLGWFAGQRGVLAGNLLIGGLGLLAVYAFARRLLGPLWALLPMATLAACMPMVAFSRGAYSEPVALVSTFGGLTLLWIAWQSGRLAHFFTAGLLIGVGSLARIDGGVTLVGVLAGFAVVTLAARSRAVRVRAALACTAWALGAGLLDGFSLIDGKINSPVYQASEWGGIFPLLVVTLLAYLLTVGVAFVPLAPLRRALATRPERWARAVLIAALGIAVVIVSRPLWWTSRTSSQLSAALGSMQKGLGLPVDPTRTYSESTAKWMAMYLSWPVVLLAAVGAALLLARTVYRRDPRLAAFVLTVACVSVLYLNQISIFPDQIWAMRRFLPVVLPGLVIAAVYPLTRLGRVRLPALGPRSRQLLTTVTVVLAVGVLVSPLVVWARSHLWPVANVQAQVAETQAACQAVGHHPVILAGPQPGSATFLPTFRAKCGTETVAYPAASTAGLATLRRNMVDPARGADTSAPVVVVFDPKSVTWQGGAPAPYMTTHLTSWDQPLQRVPDSASTADRSMWIGTLTPAGVVVPIASGPTIVNGP